MTSMPPVLPVETPAPLSDAELTLVRRQLRDSGMAVLPDVYDRAYIAELDAAYQQLLASRPADRVQATSGQRHVQMQLPLRPPFSDPMLVAHPIVYQIMAAELGDGFECSYYNSNTAYPGSTNQPVHRDSDHVFGQQLGVPGPPTGIVVNLPLCDFSETNGSTEVWPASHLIVDRPGDEDVTLDDRVPVLGSRRLNVAVGSLVLRDLRVWHRGMPNRSENARSMLAIVYKRRWLAFRHRALRVPESTWAGWPDRVRSVFASAPRDGG
jgi:hypothetical protein